MFEQNSNTTPNIPSPRPAARIRLYWRAAALLLCGLHAWTARHTMNPDGVSYLDLADAYRRGEWSAALNAYWSPLYSWLLAGALALVHPSAYWEFALVHAVNLLIFLAALVAFECFLTELLLAHRQRADDERDARALLPDWALAGLAYGVFVWTSRRLVGLAYVTPDMGVAGCVYLAAALILRIRRLGATRRRSAALGAILGTAYLTKAVMFPLSFVFLAASAWAVGSWRRAVSHLAIAATVFGTLAAVLVVPLSLSSGRPTFGDSGRLNYAWYVNGVPRWHWLGGSAGQPAHPPRRLSETPAVYEFGGPVAGTYPFWYNPPYWYEGVHVEPNLGRQAAALAHTASTYASLLRGDLLCFTGALGVLVLFALFGGASPWRPPLLSAARALVSQYPLLAPGLAAVGLYALVGHVEGRLIGPFLVLLAVALLAGLRFDLPQSASLAPLARALLAGIVLLTVCLGLADTGLAVRDLWRGEGPAAHPAWQVARELHRRGCQEGTPVGVIGSPFYAHWVRVGRHRIVAELPAHEAPGFWSAPPGVRDRVLHAFRQAGARAVLAEQVVEGDGWSRIPGTGYSVYLLDEQADGQPQLAAYSDRP
jgi:hypothetical protein